ncbi:MAG: GGDEF domain-containing protein [Gammaproteobacteria bacterium]|nr:GGDEF domain-containing protein [Gammaproteobacteria bacterium]
MSDKVEEKALSEQSDEIERLFAFAPVGLCYYDTDLRYRYLNKWLARINGVQVEACLGKTLEEVLPVLAAIVAPRLRRVIETGEAIIDVEIIAETLAHPGEPRHFRNSYYPDKSKDGTVIGVCCVVQDVTAQKVVELELVKRSKQLEHLALYDALTGLGNRNLFLKQLQHLIAIAGRKKEEVALLAMDLDGFKEVNDRLGHAGGDAVLREFGVRLGQALRQADQKYRIGGDEFAVLLEPRCDSHDGALVAADKIARHLAAPMEIKGYDCVIGVSIGVAIFPKHGEDPDTLLRKADAAMYEAKKTHQVVAGASDLDATTILKRLHSDT